MNLFLRLFYSGRWALALLTCWLTVGTAQAQTLNWQTAVAAAGDVQV